MALFRRLLGPMLDALPPVLGRVHDGEGRLVLAGRAEVRRRRGPIAWALCELMRLPREGRDVPVTVVFDRSGAGERWTRDFAGRRYASSLSARDGLLVERMGPATNIFRVEVSRGVLVLTLVGFRFLGVPVPAALRPRCRAVERDADGAFTFDIPVELPWLGPVIRYSGRLTPVEDPR